ncbi:unnamed protein product, partial [Tetraodon nigroviridis]
DSDAEGPGADRDHKSESEEEDAQTVESDEEESAVRRTVGGSDDEDERPGKQEEGGASSAEGQGSSSEEEEGKNLAADSDSDREEDKPAARSPDRRPNSDSETEMPARPAEGHMDSEEEEHCEQEPAGAAGLRWKAGIQSDSEEEAKMKEIPRGSDEEQLEEEEHRNASDEGRPVKRKKAILSDSEDEEQLDKTAVKRTRTVSDQENSDSDAGPARPDSSLAAKLRELGSDSASEDEERPGAAAKKDEKTLFGSDSDSGEDEEEKMIADIFGESGDEEEEEFTGFNQEDLGVVEKESKAKKHQEEESDSDEGMERGAQDCSFMSDFDVMLARRKAMNSKRRRHRDGGTFINDADDVVSAMISKMNEAAEEDRVLNSHKKPALKKLTLLPQVVMHLKKQDLKESFIDSGVMSAIKEWISPLPDKSLPALRIREELLRILMELPSVSQETLKHSGIGRAVMYLYKHPKESRSNKDLSLKLINEWSRPIFGLSSNYKGMTREERQQRDLDQQMPQKRRLSSGGQTPRRDLEKQLTGEEKALRPGDPGFCARARVPMPSNKDYVVRPKWNVEMDSSRGPMKKGLSRVDKQMRRFADIRRLTKSGHAVKISVEGNRMPL